MTNWRSYLQTKTRTPAFLWRMVIGIIATGVVVGLVAQQFRGPAADPSTGFEAVMQSWQQLEQLAEQGQWWQLWWAIPGCELGRPWPMGPCLLALLTGCCWFAFALQALEVRRVMSLRLVCAVVALPLGALSIWLTDFFILWQEFGWGLQKLDGLIAGVRYYVLGVGLREETAKLLCLLPLMPVLVKQRSELVALIVSSCVGLGFAVVENALYFSGSGGQDAMGRFLTANPAHMTLTGLIGLAVYRAVRDPRGWGPPAVATFGLMVFAHGLYDAAIGVPALAEYSIAGTIIFALVVYHFFGELRELRTAKGETISLSANFLFGVSLITAAAFVYLSATVGCAAALENLADGIVGLALMVYLFLREMPESMVRV